MDINVLEELAVLLEGRAVDVCSRWVAEREQIAAGYEERVRNYCRTRVPWASREEVEKPWATPFGGKSGKWIDAMAEQVGGELRQREPVETETAKLLGESIRRAVDSEMNSYLLCIAALHRWSEALVKQIFFDVLAQFSAEENVRQEMVHGQWMLFRGEIGRWVTQHGRAIVRTFDPQVMIRIDKELTRDEKLGIRGLRTVYGWSPEKAREVWVRGNCD